MFYVVGFLVIGIFIFFIFSVYVCVSPRMLTLTSASFFGTATFIYWFIDYLYNITCQQKTDY